jgi:hypothetical protein
LKRSLAFFAVLSLKAVADARLDKIVSSEESSSKELRGAIAKATADQNNASASDVEEKVLAYYEALATFCAGSLSHWKHDQAEVQNVKAAWDQAKTTCLSITVAQDPTGRQRINALTTGRAGCAGLHASSSQ